MAEALWNDVAKRSWQAFSAGSKPAGYVHPLAIKAMAELGLDIARAQSKHVDQFAGEQFDLVITVCDSAREACPSFPGARETLHWPFQDPADAEGTEAEQLEVFRQVRDQIRSRIAEFIAEQHEPGD